MAWRDVGWRENTFRLHSLIVDVGTASSGMLFLRDAWDRLNHLRIGVGLFRSTMHKQCMAPTATSEYGAKEQTAEHVIASCPIYYHPNGACALLAVDKSLLPWLTDICPAI